MEEGKKVYIGNLEYGVGEDDVRNMMTEKGINATSVNIIMDKYTGRSKGFGFAEFNTEEEAQSAIDSLNGQELNGRTLRVSKAQKMKPRRENYGDGGGYRRDRFDGGSGGNFRKGGRY